MSIWFYTTVFFTVILFCFLLLTGEKGLLGFALLAFVVSLVGSLPAFICMLVLLPVIHAVCRSFKTKLLIFLILLVIITIPYCILGGSMRLFPAGLFIDRSSVGFFGSAVFCGAMLIIPAALALCVKLPQVHLYFSDYKEGEASSHRQIFKQVFFHHPKYKINMNNYQQQSREPQRHSILIKGLITGSLILLMLIPTLFINNLITEREGRQKLVVKEVSEKWATAQTLSAPFLVVPYTDTFTNSEGKIITAKTKLVLLANELSAEAKVIPEQRPRSIYKVLLYKTEVSMKGVFKINWPADIIPANVDFANAKLCFTLSDFKGIEEEIYVQFNDKKLLLSPGLPVNDFGETGLSVPVDINAATALNGIPFNLYAKIKGSEQLHFMPMSATSKFQINSVWPSPGFDGDVLPGTRKISDSGFAASWSFNRANLPFGAVSRTNTLAGKTAAFGVSLVQPADQYNKTMRSVKYAVLFIGLTFAFFFIIELMQKKSFHPVQYVLVGLALVIFYTLLLSFSEYILFDHAYFIAAAAIIILITLYAKSHFQKWKTAGVFFGLLSALYGFIFVLIQLEDTALLIGSIGLFIVLALVMYASRKIKWYDEPATANLQELL